MKPQSPPPTGRREELIAYLKQVSGVARAARPTMRYSSTEEFVLQHGTWFTPSPRPRHLKRGVPKSCFANAARAAIESRGKLIYVEGYAMPVIPALHAWVAPADEPDKAIEVTWAKGACEVYCGLRFKTEYILKNALDRKTACLPNCLEDGFPVRTGAHNLEHALENWHQGVVIVEDTDDWTALTF